MRSWKGDTTVANVNLEACWLHGLSAAHSVLLQSGIFTGDELNYNKILQDEKGVDTLRPDKETIGVLAGDQAHINLTG